MSPPRLRWSQARASVVRATSAALDELAHALPEPVVSISLRTWPPDFPDDIAVQRRSPYEARADAIMYRQVLAELAHARGWDVHLYDAKVVVGQAVGMLGDGPTRSCRVLGDAGATVDEGPSDGARRDDRGRLIYRRQCGAVSPNDQPGRPRGNIRRSRALTAATGVR